ncbi:MAG TPA: TolC family protein [Acidobacteriota bacterium]|nr:TolC family protein [Acidobacteriota bacterium]
MAMTPRRLTSSWLVWAMLGAWLAAVDAPGPRPLTLREAAELALAHNPSVQAVREQQEAARQVSRQAKSQQLPRLDFRESFTNGNNPIYVFGSKLTQEKFAASDFDIEMLNNPDPINNFKTELTLYQSIWQGGQTQARRAMARLGEEIAAERLDQTQQQLLLEVVTHYYAIQLARQNLETVQAARRSAEASLARIQNMFDSGLVVKSDLLRMQVHIADVRRQLLEAENHLRLSVTALDIDTGRQLGEGFEPATPLAMRGDALPDEATLQAAALANRPEIAELERAIAIGREQVNEARGYNRPQVGAFATFEYDQGTRSGSSGTNYLLGVQLSYNIFDGMYKGAKVAEAEANTRARESQLRRLTQLIGLQVKDASLRMGTARQQHQVAAEAVAQADESLRIMKDRYEAGLATLTDLLNAETALTAARTSLSQAIYQYHLAHANLELAAGRLNLGSPLFQ